MIFPPATKLIKCDVQTNDIIGKWWDFVNGGNGCFYGIPYNANQVLQFNIEDKSVKMIGPLIGEDFEYKRGIQAKNGNIYCLPHDSEYFLKISPNEGGDAEVCILINMPFPSKDGNWYKGALAKDGCIYYFPSYGNRILKLDPNDGNDALSLVGEASNGYYDMTVLANDGGIYAICSGYVVKFDLGNGSIVHVGDAMSEHHSFYDGVFADDGNIYAVNDHGQILEVDTIKNQWTIIGNRMHDMRYNRYSRSWGSPVIGADKCIYFPPSNHEFVLKFNPKTHCISLIGDSYGNERSKWMSATLASDGFIYCVPFRADDILQIDSRPINERVLEMVDSIQTLEKDNCESAPMIKRRKKYNMR